MKKIFVLLMILMVLLLGCQSKEETIKVIVPEGVPSIAQSYLEYNQPKSNYKVDRVSGPQPLIAAFTSESHEIIIAPVNLGANLYQKGSPYKLAGVLTWSNLQIISRTPIEGVDDLAGKDIIAFGEGATPEMIISYLFSLINVDNPAIINYKAASAQESLLAFMQSDNALAVVSEPLTTKAKTMVDELYIFDLADLWTDYTGFNLFPLAGVFVHKNLTEIEVKKYLNKLEESSNMAINQPKKISEYCVSMEYPFDKEMIEHSIPRSQIDFKYISSETKVIGDFMNLIFDFKPALIGNALPNEDWLYPLS